MARPLRIEYPGGYFQVMNRGSRREDIFVSEQGVDNYFTPSSIVRLVNEHTV